MKPNILIFMTDQQRACSVLPDSPYKAITPSLDEFRRDSVTFHRAYCPSPHCCPSRATFFTGLMPTEHGVWNNVNVASALSRGLHEHVRPWSIDLKTFGYRMLFAGKWHVSNFQPPSSYGWEHVFPECMCPGEGQSPDEQERNARRNELDRLQNKATFSRESLRMPGEIVREGWPPYVLFGKRKDPLLSHCFQNGEDDNPFGDRTVVDAALGTLNKVSREGEPWCMFVGTTGPHDPYVVPERFIDLYAGMEIPLSDTFGDLMNDKPALYRRTRDRFCQLSAAEHKEALRHYLAFCTYEDWLFGRLINCLKERQEYENTIILYISDHGDYMGDHGLWCKGLPSFLSCYHVPAILKMPSAQKGTARDELVSLADFGPTLLEAVGVKSPVEFTGTSLMPLLKGELASNWRNALIFQTNGNETFGIQRSVLTDKWRFIYNGFDYDELYDMENDPSQMKNIAREPEYQAIEKEMYRRLWDFALSHEDQIINDYIVTALMDYGPIL